MRETEFIEQNKDKWNEFESVLKNDRHDAEKLSELFIETTDDLSYSRTFYPNRSVRVYLNGVAQAVFQRIYKTRNNKRNTFGKFWTETLPEAMWHSRIQLLISTLVFIGAFALGFFSGQQHPEYANIMLGPYYMSMTEQFIEQGDPMAVYKQMEPLEFFLFVAQNNIRVCFMDFLTGILAGAGTIFSLIFEGTRIGAFFQFFHGKGLMDEAFFAVMLHGTLELSMIVLSGCAGLTLATGLLFPGTFSRLQSLVLAARRAIVIMIGVTVFLLLAAFIEGFATRITEAPNVIRGAIIFLSLGLVIGYFVYYPWRRYRMGLIDTQKEDELQPDREMKISLNEIKTSGRIFTEVFHYFRKDLSKHVKTAVVISLIVTAGVTLIAALGGLSMKDFILDPYDSLPPPINIIWIWDDVNNFFPLLEFPLLYPLYTIAFAVILRQVSAKFEEGITPLQSINVFSKKGLNFLLLSALMLLPLFTFHIICFILLLFFWPIGLTSVAIMSHEGIGMGKAIKRSFTVIRKRWGQLFGLLFVLISVPWIAMFAQSSYIWAYLFFLIDMNLRPDWFITAHLPFLMYAAVGLFVMALVMPLFVYGYHLYYRSCLEVSNAGSLRESIQSVGFKKRAYGLEKE